MGLLVVTSALVLALPLAAHAQPADSTRILSGESDLLTPLPTPVGSSSSADRGISGDGSRIIFVSTSSGLVPENDGSRTSVFVKNTITGEVELVSRRDGAEGEVADQNCEEPTISRNGRFAAFTCSGPLDPDDTNQFTDVYRRDLATDETRLISRQSQGGVPGNDNSGEPSVADNGAVAFASTATNLIPGATVELRQVYLQIPETVNFVVSRSQVSGLPGTGSSRAPSIDSAGSRVAFVSLASNLVVGDNNDTSDVFVRLPAAGQTILASRADGQGAIGNRPSRNPVISGDGTSVAFESDTRFDPMVDPDEETDVYRRSLVVNTTAMVSVLASGETGNGESYSPSINFDGTRVGFLSDADNLDPADSSSVVDAFVRDLNSNEVRAVSRFNGNGSVINGSATSISIDDAGTRFGITLFDAPDPFAGAIGQPVVITRDESTSEPRTSLASGPPGRESFVNRGGYTEGGSISGDGRKVVFESGAPVLGANAERTVIVVRDTETGKVEIASRVDGTGGEILSGFASSPVISEDGSHVAFVHSPSASPQPFASQSEQILVRDLETGETRVVTVSSDGQPANGPSFEPVLNENGSRVAFTSFATNLDPADGDNEGDVYRHDLNSGTTTLVSRASGANGPKADSFSYAPHINGDGSIVTFGSPAGNLDPADTDTSGDVFLRDVDDRSTRLVSTRGNGFEITSEVENFGISKNGQRLLLIADFEDNGSRQAAVKNLQSGSLELASRIDGEGGAAFPGGVLTARISSDGGSVVFSPLQYESGVQIRKLAQNRTITVGRADGRNGVIPTWSRDLGLSADGSCLTFQTNGLPDVSFEFPQIYLRTLDSNCGRPDPPDDPDTRDRVAPVIRDLRAKPKRFRVKGRGRKGTVLVFRLSEKAKVLARVERAVPGRKTARGCVPARRALKRKCRAFRPVFRLVRQRAAGAVRVRIPVKAGKRRLKPGLHRITVLATDRAGNASKPARLRVRARR